MATGIIKNKFRAAKGHSFIKCDDGGDIYFSIEDGTNEYIPRPGEHVSFEIKRREKGPYASNITPLSSNSPFINPYNFITPGDVVNKEAKISHCQFIDPGGKELHSGQIICNLKIKTPLCIPDAEKTVYRTVDAINSSKLPKGWLWEHDQVDVFFKESGDGSVNVISKCTERKSQRDGTINLDDLDEMYLFSSYTALA
ncbi:MAG: cold shock domain-containing protein [Anaerolineaceae bacterium]|nr:cold shock domain-containing protein [Anaerolineaceae bacterium]